MLSYRHAFHAGNAADILKHSVLLFCLDYLGRKDTPYLCIDTHAGAGFYALTEGYALQNREWEDGIGRLTGPARETEIAALPAMLERLTALVRAFKPDPAGGGPDNRPESGSPKENGPQKARRERALGPWYPGSPALIRALLRPQDRAVCFELHPADFAILMDGLGADRRFTLLRKDGFTGLKSLLPPLSRRACIFIDPPYEVKEDYETLPRSLAEALKRFPTGIYIIWYPLLGNRDASLSGTLLGLHRGNRCRVELRTAVPADRGMYGSGLVVYNPPWTLKAALESAMPVMAGRLGQAGKADGKQIQEQGTWEIQWESRS